MMNKNQFNFLYVIGRGGFGKVSSNPRQMGIGLESRKQKRRSTLRDEGNVKVSNYYKKISQLSYE